MRRVLVAMVAVTVALGSRAATPAASADETKVALDKLPKAVVEAVKKRFPKGKMVAASTEKEDKKTVYEVTVKDGKTSIDVTLSPEGTILGLEKIISADHLPLAVRKTLSKTYPKATYKTIEEVIKVTDGEEKLAYYEVLLITEDKKKIEVEVTAEGKIKKTEKKGEKDD